MIVLRIWKNTRGFGARVLIDYDLRLLDFTPDGKLVVDGDPFPEDTIGARDLCKIEMDAVGMPNEGAQYLESLALLMSTTKAQY